MPSNKIYLTCKDVCEMTSLSKATIYRMMAEDQFPKPTPLGKRAVRWYIDEVMEWINFMQRYKVRKEALEV